MKKVLFVNHYAVPPDIGGITRHYDLCSELNKIGYDCSVLTSGFLHGVYKKHIGNRSCVEEIIGNVRFIWLKTSTYNNNGLKRAWNVITFFIHVLFFLLFKEKDYSVWYASSPHLLTPLSAVIASKIRRKKVIVEIRDVWPESLIVLGKISEKHIIAKILFAIENFVLKNAEMIIVLTDEVKDYYVERGFDYNTIAVIPNGVIDKKNAPDENVIGQLSDLYDLCKHKSVFIYAGAHGPANNLSNVIRACEELKKRKIKNIQIILVGDGPEKEKLKLMAKNLELDNILFHDTVSKSAIRLLLTEAKGVIFNLKHSKLKKYGLSSNKMFEYMYCKKPVIFAWSYHGDIVQKSGCGISIESDNPVKMADAIIEMSEKEDIELMNMGNNGYKYLMKNHQISKLAEKLTDIFNTIE